MSAHKWQCEKCGHQVTVFVKAKAITHALCSRREQRKALPQYVEVKP